MCLCKWLAKENRYLNDWNRYIFHHKTYLYRQNSVMVYFFCFLFKFHSWYYSNCEDKGNIPSVQISSRCTLGEAERTFRLSLYHLPKPDMEVRYSVNDSYMTLFRLQNSPYFCVFRYARAVKQKVWNEAENREWDLGRDTFLLPHTPYWFWEKNATVLQSRPY